MAPTATFLRSLMGQQGAQGLGTVFTSGPPNAQTPAVDGQIALDTTNAVLYGARSGGAWPAGKSLVGPVGDVGAGVVATTKELLLGSGFGTAAGFGDNATVSGTTMLPFPGSGGLSIFVSPVDTSLVGTTLVVTTGSSNARNITFSLVNLLTQQVVFTSPAQDFATVLGATYAAGAYPLSAHTPYGWAVNGAGTACFYVLPVYLMPKTDSGMVISRCIPSALNTPTGLSGTAVPLKLVGTNTCTAYVRPPGTMYLYEARLRNMGSNAATFALYNLTANTTLYSKGVSGNSDATIGPFAAGAYAMAPNTTYYWRATGSTPGTNQLYLDWRVYL